MGNLKQKNAIIGVQDKPHPSTSQLNITTLPDRPKKKVKAESPPGGGINGGSLLRPATLNPGLGLADSPGVQQLYLHSLLPPGYQQPHNNTIILQNQVSSQQSSRPLTVSD